MDLIIEKKNETHLIITAETSILYELKDEFTFFANNYFYSPLYKKKKWDGRITLLKLLTPTKGIIYFGLINKIIEFCHNRKYTFKLKGELIQHTIDTSDLEVFLNSISKNLLKHNIELRDYQVKGFKDCIKRKKQLLLSCTSSGKSLIMYMVSKYLISKGLKGLIIVPTISLIHQLSSDFNDYSMRDGWDSESELHKIYYGQEKDNGKSIFLATWQSLHTINEPEYFEQFDFVINDEVHLAKAAALTGIIEKCINASYRVGLTGTLDDLPVNEKTLIGLFGPINVLSTTKQLMKKKQVSQLHINCMVLKYAEEDATRLKKLKEYKSEVDFLNAHNKRNEYIVELVYSLDKNSLILFNYVEKHGKILYKMLLESKLRNGRNVYLIYGGVDGEERERIRKIVETEKDAIIIASIATTSTGISIRNLHNLIFASGNRSKIRTLQSIGRALRLHKDKDTAVLYDIVDDLTIGKRVNFSVKHFVSRIEMYEKEGFQYSINKVKL